MTDVEMLNKIWEKLSVLSHKLTEQEQPTYTAKEILEMAGYSPHNRSFIPYCEEKGWLKATIINSNDKKLYPRKQYRVLRKMLAQGEVTIEI